MMKTHYLKIAPAYFDPVENGDKPFEVRKDDRGFQKGDLLVLCKHDRYGHGFMDRAGGVVSGRPENKNVAKIERYISYVLTGGQFGIEPGYVILGLSTTKVTL